MIIKTSIVILLVLALSGPGPFVGADDLGPMDDGTHFDHVKEAKERWEGSGKPKQPAPAPKPPAPKPPSPKPPQPKPPSIPLPEPAPPGGTDICKISSQENAEISRLRPCGQGQS
jgi:hypothetical protein